MSSQVTSKSVQSQKTSTRHPILEVTSKTLHRVVVEQALSKLLSTNNAATTWPGKAQPRKMAKNYSQDPHGHTHKHS